jgi:PQQ-dependent dehydrogenase (methanol/ethanol family)
VTRPARQPRQTAGWPATVPPGEWHLPGRDYALTRASPLAQITTANVAALRPVWSFSTGALRAHEGNPLVVGAVMFVHGPFPNAVHALDLARPGAPILWSYAVPPAVARLSVPAGCCDVGSRGLAYHPSGKLFVPLLHGELAALDASSGREIWRVQNAERSSGGSMPAAPLVVKDLVIVGTGGAEYGVRGHLSAYEALTGRLVWRGFHTGPDADVLLEGESNLPYRSHRGPDLGISTWPGTEWQRGGATASGWLSYDPDLDLVYYGTDRPAPANPTGRPGDNKWASSIFARSAATGRVRWALQLTPHDEWGYDASNENILADLVIGGTPVKALVHFDENGYAYTIDRATGKLLLADRIGPVNWASRIDLTTATPVRDPAYAVSGARVSGICPAAAGMKGLGPAAFSPSNSLFFVPLANLCMSVGTAPVTYAAGRPYGGATIRMTAGPGGDRGRFVAWDAATSAVRWQVQEPFAVVGGALVTAGGLVFYGTMDGWLKALDQSTGRELWRFKTPSGIVGSPIAFTAPDSKQYIAVLSGIGGWLGSGGAGAFPDLGLISTPGGVLTVFGL